MLIAFFVKICVFLMYIRLEGNFSKKALDHLLGIAFQSAYEAPVSREFSQNMFFYRRQPVSREFSANLSSRANKNARLGGRTVFNVFCIFLAHFWVARCLTTFLPKNLEEQAPRRCVFFKIEPNFNDKSTPDLPRFFANCVVSLKKTKKSENTSCPPV